MGQREGKQEEQKRTSCKGKSKGQIESLGKEETENCNLRQVRKGREEYRNGGR